MIVATDIKDGQIFIHKSNYISKIESNIEEGGIMLSDAILSFGSAPTYFDSQKLSNGYFLCDGGIWANNPSFLALAEAVNKFNKNLNEIFTLSVGTGIHKIAYSDKSKYWGLLTGWKRQEFIDFILQLSSENSNNISNLLLRENYFRSNSELVYRLDDIDHLDNLEDYANKCFSDNKERIGQFLDRIKK